MFDQFALQKAVYARLVGNTNGIPVYSNVPQNTPYPYIRIDSILSTDIGTKDARLTDCEIMLSVFFKDTSSSEPVSDALKALYAALDDQQASMPMVGQRAVMIRCVWQHILQRGEPDDQYMHGMQRYHVIIEKT